MREKIKLKKEETGITLIALIITIIVLLILAGVSIATLTGENGLLNKATEAKEKSAEKAAEEKVAIEVLGSYETDGKINLDLLNNNLKNNIKGLKYNNQEISDSSKITSLPATVVVYGYEVEIAENGTVIEKESSGEITETPSREPANSTASVWLTVDQIWDYDYDDLLIEEDNMVCKYELTAIENGNAMPEGSVNGSYVFELEGDDELTLEMTFDYIGVSTYSLKRISDPLASGFVCDEDEYLISVYSKYGSRGYLLTETIVKKVSNDMCVSTCDFIFNYEGSN